MRWVNYCSGESGIEAIERAIRILDSIPIPRQKELHDFINEGKRADAFFCAILHQVTAFVYFWDSKTAFVKIKYQIFIN